LVQVGVADKRYFQGLAIPAAAGLAMSFVWIVQDLGWTGENVQFATPVLATVAGLLMVSRFRYYSFKSLPRSDKVPFIAIPVAVLILVALAVKPARVLFAITLLYALSGPVFTLWELRRKRARRKPRVEERREP
jgi:CDP-diacylglycerol--serine O-phosphatidyltransferase